uniref:Reverse transcriptase domain-containing protein n=1 Tax=Tanacetum cinerariifolium TaxID=118510 RepID=A0A699IJ94_TANCI|nr:reverse transcriptase domain-containing protein [Tanacetum cinerariifolium]
MPPRKRLCLSTLGSRYEIKESFTARPTEDRGIDYRFVSTLDAEVRQRGIREVGYGIRYTWVDPAEMVPKIAPMTMGEVNTRVTELTELHDHDTYNLYALLEDAQDSRTRISQRVAMDSQWVDLLMEDMIAYQETILIIEEETYAAREAWAHSIGLSQAVHSELQTHRESHSSHKDNRRNVQTARPCFYVDFMKYQPLNFKGTEGVGEIKKLEIKLWNLKVKGNDVLAYTEPFQELNMICTNFIAKETKKIDKYVSGLPDNIYESVKASKPNTLDETIELANDLMDQKLCTYAERQMNNKRKADDSFRNNYGHQQQPLKRKNVAKVYNMGMGERSRTVEICPRNSYDVELADGKIDRVDTIMQGCSLNFLNHLFNIDLMPVELGSFEVIIGMDWLRRCHVVIVCDEKLVRVPYGNETLIFRGNKSNNSRESRLTVISYSKAQEYMAKGFQLFVA